VTISTEGQVVTWTWSYAEPVNRPVEFALADYLREVRRLESDHSWETPDRTAGRLVLTQIDRQLFQRLGLQPYGVGNEWQAPELFRVMLMFEATYQIFLRFPWNGDTPEALAARVLATINDPSAPAGWPATWHSMPSATRDQPPRIAPPWMDEGTHLTLGCIAADGREPTLIWPSARGLGSWRFNSATVCAELSIRCFVPVTYRAKVGTRAIQNTGRE
jgi:hypothetical protein